MPRTENTLRYAKNLAHHSIDPRFDIEIFSKGRRGKCGTSPEPRSHMGSGFIQISQFHSRVKMLHTKTIESFEKLLENLGNFNRLSDFLDNDWTKQLDFVCLIPVNVYKLNKF